MVESAAIASALLSIKAVFLRPDEPFTWASGIKSPIYCDNRLTLSAPKVRTLIEDALAAAIKTEFAATELVMGTATAGIAHAALAAERLSLPMGYVRGSAKDHGRQNRIEGRLEPGDKLVVVEDLISTAGSVIECVDALREAGGEVLGVVSIFNYGMARGRERLEEAGVQAVSLCTLETLVDVAIEQAYITAADKTRLLAFRDNPQDQSWMSAS